MPRKRKRHEAFDDGYGRRTDTNRVNLSNRPITGEVSTWLSDRGFGWIYPHEDLSFIPNVTPDSQIFIHRRDVVNNSTLREGDQVRFMLYMDDRGLGGDECSRFSGDDPSGFPKLRRERPDHEAQIAVIHILIDEYFLDKVLGPRFTTFTSVKKDSGANLRVLPGVHRLKGHYSRRVSQEVHKIIRIEGTKDSIQKAVWKISKLIANPKNMTVKQNFFLKQDQAGRFIGKGGATLKKVRGESSRVNVNVSKQVHSLNEQKFLHISIKGSLDDVENAIKETVSLLHSFYCDLVRKNPDDIIYPLTPFEHQNPLSRGINL